MARTLSPRDIEILKKMVPELADDLSMPRFRSILPPVSMRFCSNQEDFRTRLDRLNGKEITYLVDLIFSGEECLSCLREEYTDILLDRVRKNISHQRADDLMELLGYIREG